jgi:hypothetical protein
LGSRLRLLRPEGAIPSPPSKGDRNSAAVAAFDLGLLSVPLFAFGLAAILAIVLGLVGWRNAFYGAPHPNLAMWGVGLGILGLFLTFAFWSSPG